MGQVGGHFSYCHSVNKVRQIVTYQIGSICGHHQDGEYAPGDGEQGLAEARRFVLGLLLDESRSKEGKALSQRYQTISGLQQAIVSPAD